MSGPERSRGGAPGEVEAAEVEALLTALQERYGHDLRGYARASLRRRLRHALEVSGAATLSELQGRVLRDTEAFAALIADLSVTTTEMFRDPTFYVALRRHVLPVLRTYPSLRVWVAGCATGEEAWSVAILLQEEGLYDRARIYATDTNRRALETAREGIYSSDAMRDHTANYRAAGGQDSFSSYWRARYGFATMRADLRPNLLFSDHNLATDAAFGRMHLILCRNVMIYFNATLQERVTTLFADSLDRRGFLALGTRESLRSNAVAARFEVVAPAEKIYRLRSPTGEGA